MYLRLKLYSLDYNIFKGYVSYQNELNDENKPFFDICDGIFTNYWWSPNSLDRSINALENNSRKKDIFIGVDVWGRGTYGGGQFSCNSVIFCHILPIFKL